jgi:hypothetical protein
LHVEMCGEIVKKRPSNNRDQEKQGDNLDRILMVVVVIIFAALFYFKWKFFW